MARRLDDRRLCVFHIASGRSGGQIVTYDIDAFLIRDRYSPQGQALLELLGIPATDSTEATFDERLAGAVSA
ncbi:hypothetical protein [Thiocapsa sp.]|uniref:hypothetical protein n=1 Tax=Thiocapsa sp. TaxID=2024551 RepID=UPI00359434AB